MSPGSAASILDRCPSEERLRSFDLVLCGLVSSTESMPSRPPDELMRFLRLRRLLAVVSKWRRQTNNRIPSVRDYVQFQLLATPMASLRRAQKGRSAVIAAVATEAAPLSDPKMLEAVDSHFSARPTSPSPESMTSLRPIEVRRWLNAD